jgi:hypothetical protein
MNVGKKEIKEKYLNGLKRQLIHDYHLLFDENEFMTKRNALRTLQREWNMPIDLIKSIVEND